MECLFSVCFVTNGRDRLIVQTACRVDVNKNVVKKVREHSLHQHRAVYNLLSDATQQLAMTRIMQLLVAAEAANSPPVTLRESTCRAAVLSNLQRQIA